VSNRYPEGGAVSVNRDAKQAVEDDVGAFDEGGRVTAYVDPRQPGEASIEAALLALCAL
jgi:hypothetical protein